MVNQLRKSSQTARQFFVRFRPFYVRFRLWTFMPDGQLVPSPSAHHADGQRDSRSPLRRRVQEEHEVVSAERNRVRRWRVALGRDGTSILPPNVVISRVLRSRVLAK